ncbi:CDP-diacylglycerol--serine O-phosphatidyltransferase [Algoriphagus confluentis]|uniref:CDP-diacylglycerol--serine O-phosphatidyltransferase n=1 Tax=Algoriphagus confluentis TaxID=1697556 RepID=A0ABQ6PRC0_9BACT|nr:CDP-alcohol phosphatidyltransferase family protein [Algoriphagus confluentis]
MTILRHIPNFITLLNLLTGVLGIIAVLEGKVLHAATYVLLAAALDFLDGLLARLLNVQSGIGKELDSLADVVSFGVLPGIVLFRMTLGSTTWDWLPYFTLIVPMLSAYRLAKFNLDTRQNDRFIGLPTPANALFISTLPHLALLWPKIGIWITGPVSLLFIAWFFSILLVAELPLIALKFKHFRFSGNQFRFLLVGVSFLAFGLFQLAGIPLIILTYILLSIAENLGTSE